MNISKVLSCQQILHLNDVGNGGNSMIKPTAWIIRPCMYALNHLLLQKILSSHCCIWQHYIYNKICCLNNNNNNNNTKERHWKTTAAIVNFNPKNLTKRKIKLKNNLWCFQKTTRFINEKKVFYLFYVYMYTHIHKQSIIYICTYISYTH